MNFAVGFNRAVTAVRRMLLALALATLPGALSWAQEASLPPPDEAPAAESSADPAATLDVPSAEPSDLPHASARYFGAAEEAGPSGAEAAGSAQIEEYRAAQSLPPAITYQEVHSSPLGFELREDVGRLTTGEVARGLLIVRVANGSPAAEAGLRSYGYTVHAALDVAAAAAALFFPPAFMALPMIDQTEIGESYDLIVGVDGSRIRNYFDFEELTRGVKPGDIYYLSIIRDGKRMQVVVQMTEITPSIF